MRKHMKKVVFTIALLILFSLYLWFHDGPIVYRRSLTLPYNTNATQDEYIRSMKDRMLEDYIGISYCSDYFVFSVKELPWFYFWMTGSAWQYVRVERTEVPNIYNCVYYIGEERVVSTIVLEDAEQKSGRDISWIAWD